MKLLLTFSELQELIRNKVGKEPEFSMIDSSTLNVSYTIEVTVPFFGSRIKKKISIQVSITQIDGTDVYLNYDSGLGVDMILSGVLRLFQGDPNFSVIEVGGSKQVILHLGQIEKIKSVFDKVEIRSINIMNVGLDVDCKLKDIL